MEGVRAVASFIPHALRRLYDWVLSWAERPGSTYALFVLAFAEASFFPIPPDVLLIALALSVPARSMYWAAVCSAGSVLGGMAGYLLGWQFMASIGRQILAFYHLTSKYELVKALYQQYDAWAVAAAGFTPLPYKLFTITAGAFDIDFGTFAVASALSRSGRFFLVAGLIYFFGPSVRNFLERYFNICSVVFFILLIGGFVLVKWILS